MIGNGTVLMSGSQLSSASSVITTTGSHAPVFGGFAIRLRPGLGGFGQVFKSAVPGGPGQGIPPNTGPTGPGGNAPAGVNPKPVPPLSPAELAAREAARQRANLQPRMGTGSPRGGQFIPNPSLHPNIDLSSGVDPLGRSLEPDLVIDARTGQRLDSGPRSVPSSVPGQSSSIPQAPSPPPQSAQLVPPSTHPQPIPPSPISAKLGDVVERVAKGGLSKFTLPLIFTEPTPYTEVGIFNTIGNFGVGQFNAPGPSGLLVGILYQSIFVARQIARAYDLESTLQASYNVPSPQVARILDKYAKRGQTFSSIPHDGI